VTDPETLPGDIAARGSFGRGYLHLCCTFVDLT